MLTKRGQYQILPLNSLHNFFKVNPIFINGETTSRAWRTISIIYSLLALIGLVIWHTILRLMVILLIALVLWGIVSLIRPRTGFGPILIAGIYSLVPAIYLHFLFGLLHFSFPFLQTILLTVFWAIALVITFVEIEFLKEQKQLRIWRAALGIPMLLAFAVEAIIKLQPGVAVCWIIFLFTIFILGAISLYLRIRNINVEQTTTKLL
jgi:predicted membrane channel-forming protein YqfA (hemolysin III family)